MKKFLKLLFPLRYSYSRLAWVYIHKRRWHNRLGPVSQGERCQGFFGTLNLGKGDKCKTIPKCSALILLINAVIPCVFLLFLVEKNKLYFIYKEKTYFGPFKNYNIPSKKKNAPLRHSSIFSNQMNAKFATFI